MRLTLDVHVHRGPVREAVHRVECAVADGADAAPGASAAGVTMMRSAAKPFQLLPFVERGHAGRWAVTGEELAVMTASHTGSDYHRRLVLGLLERIGATTDDLECGYHDPSDPDALSDVLRHPERRSALHNNCSGKHAGMLALCRAEGWPTHGYVSPDHPVQQLCRRTVAELCGVSSEDVLGGTDGCSVVSFGLPLEAMARGYARLSDARPTAGPREAALARIRAAMTDHPVAVEGESRLSTEIMRAGRGTLVAKCGAEGLQLVGSVPAGRALAVKCRDGATRPIAPAVITLLDRLGWLTPEARAALEPLRSPALLNAAGLETGRLEVVVQEDAVR